MKKSKFVFVILLVAFIVFGLIKYLQQNQEAEIDQVTKEKEVVPDVSTNSAPFLLLAGDVDPPLKWLDENGEIVGIEIDILTRVYNSMKDIVPEYRFKIYKSSTRVKQDLKDGIVDQYITMSRKPERMKYLKYPNESHLSIKWVFFLTKKFQEQQRGLNKEIKFEKYEDLAPYKVGVTPGYAYSKDFWSAVDNNLFIVDKLTKNDNSIKKLLMGRIDLFPSYQFKMQWLALKGGYLDQITYLPNPIRNKPYFHPFSKASNHPAVKNGTVIKRYDEMILKLKKNGFIKKVFQKYGIN